MHLNEILMLSAAPSNERVTACLRMSDDDLRCLILDCQHTDGLSAAQARRLGALERLAHDVQSQRDDKFGGHRPRW